MNLKNFRDILLKVTDKVYHFESHKEENNYIVWYETGKKSLKGDNQTAESGMRIAVDFFTKDEYDTIHEKLENVLDECDEIFISDSVSDYEHDTGYIHYAYTCEVI